MTEAEEGHELSDVGATRDGILNEGPSGPNATTLRSDPAFQVVAASDSSEILENGREDEDKESTILFAKMHKRQKYGFYLYDFGVSAFSNTGFLIPVLITQLAQKAALAVLPEQQRVMFESLLNTSVACGGDSGSHMNQTSSNISEVQLRVDFAGTSMDYRSVEKTVFSISVVLQIIAFLLLGGLADYGGKRKAALAVATVVGGIVTMMLVLAVSWQVISAFFVIGNVVYGLSVVYYNSFLPIIATPSEVDKVGGKGFLIGYIGGFISLIL
mmetsp:Transcript_23022/g.58382  ORF Transcript_23022/g.58382 Transcript_23022/m.58382 type:complete len:271 (-) Transcript_23022:98-910(-)